MTKNTGGQAFPFAVDSEIDARTFYNEGMTLRDYFAGQALVKIWGHGTTEEISKMCYEIADAMLKERSRDERD